MFFVEVHWMEFVSHVKFRQLQTQRNLSRRGRMVVEFTTISSGTPRAFPQVKKQAQI
jgi:hypothetical protein